MGVKEIIIIYCCAGVIFFFFDIIWLGVVARNFYRAELGHLLRKDVNWSSAVIFYFLYTAGVCYFAVCPAVAAGSPLKAVIDGTVLGFFAYMTYNLTNHAIFKYWPVKIVVVDILWGAGLTGMVSFLTVVSVMKIFSLQII